MRYLVGTHAGQGERGNDFCFVDEGEPLVYGFDCDRDPDGPCGCRRSLSGLRSDKGTTTFVVADIRDTQKGLAAAFDERRKAQGWDCFTFDDALRHVREIAGIARRYPVGTLLERRADIAPRERP